MAGFLRAGEHFAGRYRIDHEIGRGGMGVVYEAYDQDLGRRVALKLLHPTLTDDEFRVRFQREASILARIRSRHIVTIHDFGEHEGQSYLITQLMSDGDLQSWLRHRGPLPRLACVSLTAQVAEGLADAHAERVVHRDVKPGNVLLWTRPSGLVPYLCDFGIAVDGEAGLTRTGTLIGSPAYMAPERHHGAPADERGDIYSVGCLFWAVLTGDAPYSGTDFQVANAHINGPIPQLDTGSEDDRQIDALLLRCMSKDPDERIGSAAELQSELQALSAQLSKTSATSFARPHPMVEPEASPGKAETGPGGESGANPTVMRSAAPATVQKPRLADPTMHKGAPSVPNGASPPPPPPAPPPPASTGSSRRWPVLVGVATLVLLLAGATAAVAISRSGDDTEARAQTVPTSAPEASPSPPPAPQVRSTGGYRAVTFSISRPPSGTRRVAVQWRKGDQWVPASKTVRLPTRQGGDRVCIRTRSTIRVGATLVTSDPNQECGRSTRRVVELLRTKAPCTRVIGGYSYRCVYYAVRVAGFASRTRPVAEIRPLVGRSWCSDPRYKDRFCKRVEIGKDGRGALMRYFAISAESGQAVLEVDGVRTKPVHLCGPAC